MTSDDQIAREVAKFGGARTLIDIMRGCSTNSMHFTNTNKLNDDAMLEAVTNAVQNLVTDSETRQQVLEAGGVEELIALCERSTNEKILLSAAQALCLFCGDEETRPKVAAAAGPMPLLRLCNTSTSVAVLQGATGALWHLLRDPVLREGVLSLDGGAVAPLVRVCAICESDAVLRLAAGSLWHLVADSSAKQQVIREGGVLALVKLCATSTDVGVLAASAGGLQLLTRDEHEGESGGGRQMVVEAGGLAPLIQQCRFCTDSGVVSAAARALWHLVRDYTMRMAVAEGGGGDAFVRLCECAITTAPSSAQATMAAEGAAWVDVDEGLLRVAVQSLRLLSSDGSIRHMLANARAVRPLVELAKRGGKFESGAVQEEAVWALRGLAVEQGRAVCEEVARYDGVGLLLALCHAVMGTLAARKAGTPAPTPSEGGVSIVGDPSRVQEHALWALALLVEAEDGVVRRQLANQQSTEVGGINAVQMLAQLCEDKDGSTPALVLESVTAAIKALAADKLTRQQLHKAGGLRALVALCRSGGGGNAGAASAGVVEQAALALGHWAADASLRLEVLDADGMGVLLHLLQTSSHSGTLAASAAALGNLAQDAYMRSQLEEAGFLSTLISILKSGHEDEVMESAACSLGQLTLDSSMRQAICTMGGITALVDVCATAVHDGALEGAALALGALATDETLHNTLASAGVIDAMVRLCRVSENRGVLERACTALGNLAMTNSEMRLLVVEAGAMVALLELAQTLTSTVGASSSANQSTRGSAGSAGAAYGASTAASNAMGGATHDSKALRAAVCTLKYLLREAQLRQSMAAGGEGGDGIAVLIRLCRLQRDCGVLEQTAKALHNLSADEALRPRLVQVGGIGALVQLIEQSTRTDDVNYFTSSAERKWGMLEGAAATIKTLSTDVMTHAPLLSEGTMPALVKLCEQQAQYSRSCGDGDAAELDARMRAFEQASKAVQVWTQTAMQSKGSAAVPEGALAGPQLVEQLISEHRALPPLVSLCMYGSSTNLGALHGATSVIKTVARYRDVSSPLIGVYGGEHGIIFGQYGKRAWRAALEREGAVESLVRLCGLPCPCTSNSDAAAAASEGADGEGADGEGAVIDGIDFGGLDAEDPLDADLSGDDYDESEEATVDAETGVAIAGVAIARSGRRRNTDVRKMSKYLEVLEHASTSLRYLTEEENGPESGENDGTLDGVRARRLKLLRVQAPNTADVDGGAADAVVGKTPSKSLLVLLRMIRQLVGGTALGMKPLAFVEGAIAGAEGSKCRLLRLQACEGGVWSLCQLLREREARVELEKLLMQELQEQEEGEVGGAALGAASLQPILELCACTEELHTTLDQSAGTAAGTIMHTQGADAIASRAGRARLSLLRGAVGAVLYATLEERNAGTFAVSSFSSLVAPGFSSTLVAAREAIFASWEEHGEIFKLISTFKETADGSSITGRRNFFNGVLTAYELWKQTGDELLCVLCLRIWRESWWRIDDGGEEAAAMRSQVADQAERTDAVLHLLQLDSTSRSDGSNGGIPRGIVPQSRLLRSLAAQVLLLLTRNHATRARLVGGGAVPLLLQLMGTPEDSYALLDCTKALTGLMLVSKTAEQAAAAAMPVIGSTASSGRRAAGGGFSAAWSVQQMVLEGGGVALVLAKLREGEVHSHVSMGGNAGEIEALGLTINNDILAQVALLLAQMVANEEQLKAMSTTHLQIQAAADNAAAKSSAPNAEQSSARERETERCDAVLWLKVSMRLVMLISSITAASKLSGPAATTGAAAAVMAIRAELHELGCINVLMGLCAASTHPHVLCHISLTLTFLCTDPASRAKLLAHRHHGPCVHDAALKDAGGAAAQDGVRAVDLMVALLGTALLGKESGGADTSDTTEGQEAQMQVEAQTQVEAVSCGAAGVLMLLALDEAAALDIVKAGAVELLLQLLGSKEQRYGAALMAAAAGCVHHLAGHTSLRNTVAGAGAVAVLMGVSAGRKGEKEVVEQATAALQKLSDAGGVEALIECVETNTGAGEDASTVEVVRQAATQLRELASEKEQRPKLLEAGGVPALIKLLEHSTDAGVLIEASWAMRLLSEDLKIRREVANGGAIAALVQLVSDTSKGASSNQRILERVAWALRNFTKDRKTRPAVVEAGGVEALVRLCDECDHRSVLEEASWAMRLLVEDTKTRPKVAAAGGVGALIKLCESSTHKVVLEEATTALQLLTQ
jgi:hypothetical protein